MMSEWKVRQEIYHRLHKYHRDDLTDKPITMTTSVVEGAVKYFTEQVHEWVYPSKSYMVGICYARWLAEEWGGDPLTYLNDVDLLHGNDPYFVPYHKDSATYDAILSTIGGWSFDTQGGLVPDVREYFSEEFMLVDS